MPGWYYVAPLSDQTQFKGEREVSRFTASWSDTEGLLYREVEFLYGTNVTLEIDILAGDLRLDGGIRANAKPKSPGVRLVFDSQYGRLAYATDRYYAPNYRAGPDWHHNVRAIALGLQALRTVDRYGITQKGQQYTGFRALTDGTGSTGLNVTEARHVLSEHAGYATPGVRSNAELYRAARIRAHPDRNGGVRGPWDRVEQAGKVLGL